MNIYFVLDSFELYKDYWFGTETFCQSYMDTELAIENKLEDIWTYDIGHLSFDLENLGYRIWIIHNYKFLYVYPGMSTANGKEIRVGHNIRKILIGGGFDQDLGLNIKRSNGISANYMQLEKKFNDSNIQEARDNFMYDYVNGYNKEIIECTK